MFYDVAKALVAPTLRTVCKPEVIGVQNLPATGGVVLASNHLAVADTWVMPSLLPRTVHFLAKSDYFAGGSLANRAVGLLLRGLGVMPINRSGGSASRSALAAGLEILARGEVLGIYPEGSRSPDGRMYRGKTGAARLALESGCPLVPVAMIGSFEAQRGRRLLPRRRPRMRIVLGEALDARALVAEQGLTLAGEQQRAVTEALMAAIAALSGQERTQEYAADAKRRLRAEQSRD